LQLADINKTGGYDKDQAAKAVIAHFRNILSGFNVEIAKDRARICKAEADNAELTLSERRGEIHERVGRALTDVALRVRGLLMSIEYVPAKSRERCAKDFGDAQLLDGFHDIMGYKRRRKTTE
jgi:hypothetical protein